MPKIDIQPLPAEDIKPVVVKARRVIRPVPTDTIELLPPQAVLANGCIDYLDDGQGDVPADAVYVAHMDEAGAVEVVKDESVAMNAVHTFAGWEVPAKGAEELAAVVAATPVEVVKP